MPSANPVTRCEVDVQMDGSGDCDMGADMGYEFEDPNGNIEMINFETEADGDVKMEVVEGA
jgi:hypothetical protein